MMCNEQLHMHALSMRCLSSLADWPVFVQRYDNRRSWKPDCLECRRSSFVQHNAIRVAMVRMHTAGSLVPAARRKTDGVYA